MDRLEGQSFHCEPICRVERFQSRGISHANTQEKSSTPTGLVWDTNIAAVSLFRTPSK